jgi:hypothetical protein
LADIIILDLERQLTSDYLSGALDVLNDARPTWGNNYVEHTRIIQEAFRDKFFFYLNMPPVVDSVRD